MAVFGKEAWQFYFFGIVDSLKNLIDGLYEYYQTMSNIGAVVNDSRRIAFYHGSVWFINDMWSNLCELTELYGGPEETKMLEELEQFLPRWIAAKEYFTFQINSWISANNKNTKPTRITELRNQKNV